MQESNAFVLLNDEQNPLTSGMLRKPLSSCFSDTEDEYQFEHKEYLICVEKGSLSKDERPEPPSLPQPKRPLRPLKRAHVGRLAPINKEANPSSGDTDLIQPRSKEEQETVDLFDLLAPKKVDRNVSSQDINSLLSLLDRPTTGGTKSDSFGGTILENQSSLGDTLGSLPSFPDTLENPPSSGDTTLEKPPSFPTTLTNPPPTPSLLSTINPRTPPLANDMQKRPSNLSTPVSLPTRRAIQSKDYSYFAFAKPAFSSLQSYQDYQEAAMKSLIRHLVFRAIER